MYKCIPFQVFINGNIPRYFNEVTLFNILQLHNIILLELLLVRRLVYLGIILYE